MIAPLYDWSWESRASEVLLRPIVSPAGTEIRYLERLRPLRRVADLVADAPAPRGWIEDERSSVEPFETHEGEYAAQVTLHGTIAGVPAVRSFAFVFGDDFVARIAGLAPRIEDSGRLTGAIRHLALFDTHVLGVRRRRYVFTAPRPSAWHGHLEPPFHAYYHPLAYPRDNAAIAVLPALPASTEQVLAILLESGPGTTDGEIPQMLLVADSGLSGSWYSLGAGDTLWDFVIFADDRYTYSMAMKTDPKNRGAHVETFAEVARSVQPIPRPMSTRKLQGASSLLHWTE